MIRNEVIGLGEGGQPLSTGGVFGTGNDFVAYTDIGLPMAIFYGYETAGIFQTDEEAASNTAQPGAMAGDVIFVDQNGDGALTRRQDRHRQPPPGLHLRPHGNVKYKQFDLSLFIQGSHGNDLYNGIFRYDLNTTNLPVSALAGPEGSTNEHPRISHVDANQNNRVSDRFIEDGPSCGSRTCRSATPSPTASWRRWTSEIPLLPVGEQPPHLDQLYRPRPRDRFPRHAGNRHRPRLLPRSRNFIAGVNVTF